MGPRRGSTCIQELRAGQNPFYNFNSYRSNCRFRWGNKHLISIWESIIFQVSYCHSLQQELNAHYFVTSLSLQLLWHWYINSHCTEFLTNLRKIRKRTIIVQCQIVTLLVHITGIVTFIFLPPKSWWFICS